MVIVDSQENLGIVEIQVTLDIAVILDIVDSQENQDTLEQVVIQDFQE